MDNHNHQKTVGYSIKDFIPLLIIAAVIILCTVFKSMLFRQWNVSAIMRDFMGFFFLIFGLFKIMNLNAFAQAYAEYDIIAKQFFGYGYLYPFFELSLAIAYLSNWNPLITNTFTLILMLISAYGVFIELRKGRAIVCACLGVVFKLPMTWVTLSEDLLMAAMAMIMLVI